MKTKALILSLSLSIAAFNSFAQVGGTPAIQNTTQTQAADGTMPGWAASARIVVDGLGKALPAFGPTSGVLSVFLGLTGFIVPNPAMTNQQNTQQTLGQIKNQLSITNSKLDNITSMYIQDSSIAEEKNLFEEIKVINDSSSSYTAELGNSKSLDDYMIANQNNFSSLKVIDSTIGSVDAYNKIKQARTIISTTKYLNQLIAVIQRVNEKVNLPAPGTTDYIALHDSTNQLFLYYYSSIVAALSEAYELNRLAFYLESNDPYKNYYATRIGNADGILSSLTYAEKIAKLDEIYKTALDNVNKAFNQQKIINVYRDLPYYDGKTSAKDFFNLYGITFYDGKTIKGEKNYGQLKSVPYTVDANEIYELGKVRQYNGQAYYVNQANQDIYTPNFPAHVISAADASRPISAATRYDWFNGRNNIVIGINSFAYVNVVERLYSSAQFQNNIIDSTLGKVLSQRIETYDGDFATDKSFNSIMVANEKSNGKKYLFSLSTMQIGGNNWGYMVKSRSAYVVSRLACATFDCNLVQPKDGSHSYLEYADGYKIWMTGDGSTNPGRGIVGSYTEKPSRQ